MYSGISEPLSNDRPSPVVRPLTFFVVTFLVSWLIWIPLVFSHFGVGPFHISEDLSALVRLLGVLIPSITAILLTLISGKPKAVRDLLKPIRKWRVGWRWWVAAVLVQPALLVISALIYNMIQKDTPVTAVSIDSASGLIISVLFLLLATLGEEIGWRGLALPALEQHHSAFKASIILGLLWASWHVPFWLLLDTFDQYGFAYLALNYIFILLGTFYITWFYNHGRFSLLLPVMFHITFNIVNVALLPVTSSIGAFGIVIAFNFLITLLVARRLEPGHSDLKVGR
jgi:uncharacterized protein